MGTPVYNLVIVKGEKKELNEYDKKAFKNEKDTFCIEQLLPLYEHLTKRATSTRSPKNPPHSSG
jgi:hypothetical protein